MSAEPVLRARSGDAPFLALLAGGNWYARVHSVFERVVNIETAAGELWTLAARDCDNAPNTLIVDAPGFSTFSLAPGDAGQVVAGELRLAPALRVRVAGAAVWDGRLPAYPADARRLRANLPAIEAALGARGGGGGFRAPRQSDSPFLRAVSAQLETQSERLVAALARGDAAAAGEHALALVGLGPGLTPSGDDYLCGLFAVLNIADGPLGRWRGFAETLAARAAGQTNAISLAMLKMAAAGRLRESIVDLLRAALFADGAALEPALARVLAIGSSSGADIVSGLVAGFTLALHSDGGPLS